MKFLNLTPELMVADVTKSVAFYSDVFGFSQTISFPDNQPIFAAIEKDGLEIMLYQSAAFSQEIPQFKDQKPGATIALYIQVEDIESFYEQVQDRVKVVQPLHQTDYGSTEFSCLDLDGYVLMFSQRS